MDLSLAISPWDGGTSRASLVCVIPSKQLLNERMNKCITGQGPVALSTAHQRPPQFTPGGGSPWITGLQSKDQAKSCGRARPGSGPPPLKHSCLCPALSDQLRKMALAWLAPLSVLCPQARGDPATDRMPTDFFIAKANTQNQIT